MSLSRIRRAQFRFWRYAEPRAIFEWQSFYALRPLLKKLPQGDGHAVIVFPGFASSDKATKPLRTLLNDLNYQAHGWGLGQNLLFDQSLEEEMIALVKEVASSSGGKVSLVGWSLGGLYAREVAKRCLDDVRCVISMGSPISGNQSHSNAHVLFQALNGQPSEIEISRSLGLNKAPSVPTTSIFSKTDGIVAWEGSVQNNVNQLSENIVVPASHLGLGVNPLVMMLLSDRLSQPLGQWRKFKRRGLSGLLLKTI